MLAGEHALRRGAPVEAERILATATRSLPREELPQWQTVRALRLHAQALAALGRMAGCIEACLRGLAVLGEPVPASKAGLLAGVLWQAGGQLRRLVYPLPLSSESPLLRQEAAQLLALVGEASVFELQHLRTAYCMLASTNAADDCQAVEQQIYGYGTVALLLSLTPLRRAAPATSRERRRFAGQSALGTACRGRAASSARPGAGQLRTAARRARREHDRRAGGNQAQRRAAAHGQLDRSPHEPYALRRLRNRAPRRRRDRAARPRGTSCAAADLGADHQRALFLRMGELGRAHLELARTAESVKHAMDQAARCAVDALRAQLRLRQGHAEGCLELLVPTIKTLLAAKVTVPGLLVCFRGLLDTGLAWLEQPGRSSGRRCRAGSPACTAGSAAAALCPRQPLARPAASLSSGQLALAGRRVRSRLRRALPGTAHCHRDADAVR